MRLMGAERFVNVSYQGIDVGQSLKLIEFGPHTAYLELVTPMPVGTALRLETDAGLAFDAQVVRVQEQVAGAEHQPGMRIRVGDVDEAVAAWWQPLVDTTDPVLPEPAEVSEAAVAPAPAAEAEAVPDAVPEAVDADVTVPTPKEPRRTAVMDANEIRAAIEAGGHEVEAEASSKNNGKSKRAAAKDAAKDAAAKDAAAKDAAAKDADKSGDTDDGKPKRRRRRRKSRRS